MNGVTIYTTGWCGFCARLKSQLRRQGIGFDEVDIDLEPKGAEIVAAINHGNRTVPTVVFIDGSAMTNPSAAQVADKLGALG